MVKLQMVDGGGREDLDGPKSRGGRKQEWTKEIPFENAEVAGPSGTGCHQARPTVYSSIFG